MVTHSPIYLDYAAATPMLPEVVTAMEPYLTTRFYNPSSSYLAARAVQKDVEAARARVAGWLGAKSAEVIFTAGATEANNLAIHGVMQRHPGANVLVASTDHEAVLAPARQYAHELIPVTPKGGVDMVLLRNLIDERTVLISVALANNETGVVQPLSDIAALIGEVRQSRRQNGNELPLYLHTDAAQAASYLDLHAARLGVDLLTLNGGKMYGPKQTGVLYVAAHVALQPQVSGGKQERGLRSGTENVPGILGLAMALDLAQTNRKAEGERQRQLRNALQAKLQTAFPAMSVNGDQHRRLPGNLNVAFPGLDGERLLMAVDEKGLQIATGAACSANRETTGSHVLKAMGLDAATIGGSIRLSLGEPTTESEIQQAADIIIQTVKEMQWA